MSGGRLDIFQAGTISTRQNAFRESSLVNPYSNPIILESDGRVPHLWLADGGIKIRLSDTTGVVQFESDNLPVIGSSGGGGGVDTTDPNSIFSTGMPLWMPITGTKAGWVRLNARTIGPAASGATERANADCEQLFLHFWNNFSDSFCPVSTGRGANAAADWSAGTKTIGTLDMRGRGAFGVADMGNSAINRIKTGYFDGGSNIIGGSTAGQDDLLIVQGNIPAYTLAHTLGVSGELSNPGQHVLAQNKDNNIRNDGGSLNDVPKGASVSQTITWSGSVSGTVTSNGGGSAFETVMPIMVGSWFMRL